jgi:hypothetical protein
LDKAPWADRIQVTHPFLKRGMIFIATSCNHGSFVSIYNTTSTSFGRTEHMENIYKVKDEIMRAYGKYMIIIKYTIITKKLKY